MMHHGRDVRGFVSAGSPAGGAAGTTTGIVCITAGDLLQVFVAQFAFVFAAHSVCVLVFVFVSALSLATRL